MLLALQRLTLLSTTRLLTVHVFVGMVLVPPILVKMGSTFARFVNYYRGVPSYRAKGPPTPLLRLAGPLVAASTVVLLGSGIALLYVPIGDRGAVLGVHKATFVLWFGVMVVHVLGHLLDTARLAPRDYVPTRRLYLRGAPARQLALGARLALGASLVLGFLLGVAMIPRADTWLR